MANYAISASGMGDITAGTLATTGMDVEDHMHFDNAFLATGQYGAVQSSGDCLVTENSPAGMSVLVAAGTYWVKNTSWSAGSTSETKYHAGLGTEDTVTIKVNASGNPRIDLICKKRDASASPDDTGSNVLTSVAIEGTPAASPVAPAIPADGNDYLILAQVAVANGASSITDANITDRRVFANIRDNNNLSGWIPDEDTWVYASASTFTIAGKDVTSKFPVGTRLRFEQTLGTPKYAVVTASAFSTDTTVTIAVNTDYTIANSTIYKPYYSYASNPVGYPDWFNFTPAWTGITVGNGTSSGIYRVLGRLVEGRVNFTMGSTSSVGEYVIFTPPVALTFTGKYMCGEMFYEDAGIAGYSGFLRIDGSANLNPNISTGGGINTTSPFTWGTGDLLGGMFRYPLGV